MQSVDGDIRLSAAISFNSKSLIQSSKNLQKSVANVFTSLDKSANKSSAMRSLELQMEKATAKLAKMTKEFEELGNAKIPTTAAANLQEALDKTNAKAVKLQEQLKKLEGSRSAKKSGRYDAIQKELEETIYLSELYASQLMEMDSAGTSYAPGSSTPAYKDMAVQLHQQLENISILMQKHTEMEKKQNDVTNGTNKLTKSFGILRKTGSSAIQRLVKALNGMFSVLGKIRLAFAKMFKHVNKHSSFSLKKLVAYGLGIRSLYVLIRRLSTYATDAFKGLAAQSSTFNTEMSSMMTGLAQLKGSLATAFQPIMSYVIPVINQLTAALNTCMNAIGKFFASLTGQGYIYKYTAAQQDFADSLDKTGASAAKAKKSLMGFDELNVLSDNDTGGGGGGATDAGKYEQIPVDPNSSIAEFTKKLKEAWKKADFTEIGSIVGKKLKKALDSIPWNDIFNFSERVGTSLGTFLNGLVSVAGLADSLATTLVNAINTIMIALNAFLTSTNWKDVGQFIADFANTAIKDFNWNLLGKTVADLLMAGINTWWTFVGPDGFDFKQLGTKISNAVNTMLKALGAIDEDGLSGWSKLGQTISNSVRGIFDAMITALNTIDWNSVGTAIGELINSIDWEGIVWDLTRLVTSLVSALGKAFLNWAATEPISAGIAAMLMLAFTSLKLSPILKSFSTIGSNIAEVISLAAGGAGTLGEAIDAVFGTGAATLSGIVSVVGGAILAITNFFSMLKEGFSWAKEAFMLLGIALVAVGAVILGVVTGPVAAVIAAIVAAVSTAVILIKQYWNEIVAFFKPILTGIVQTIKAIGQTILVILTGLAGALFGLIGGIATFIVSCVGMLVEVIANIVGFIVGVIVSAVTGIVGFITGVLGTIYNVIKTVLQTIHTIFETIFKLIVAVVTGNFGSVKTIITNGISAVKTVISNGITAVKDVWVTVWTKVSSITTSVWKGISNTIKGVVNGIVGFINGMIRGVVGGLNAIIGLLNKLKIDIPDWIPELGGKSFGFNLKTMNAPQIPYLAKGAVIPPNKEFMAVLGDQTHGTNIEAPLDTIKQAVAEELNEYIDAMMTGFQAVVEAVNNKDFDVKIGDSIIGKAAERYSRRQALVRGTT